MLGAQSTEHTHTHRNTYLALASHNQVAAVISHNRNNNEKHRSQQDASPRKCKRNREVVGSDESLKNVCKVGERLYLLSACVP